MWCKLQVKTPSELECIHGILTPCASPYVTRSIPPVFSHMGVWVALLTVTTTCDYERGGATKPIIIGSSWFFVDYDVCKRLCDPAWSIFQYFFWRTHTHWHEGIALPLLCMRARGNKPTHLFGQCWVYTPPPPHPHVPTLPKPVIGSILHCQPCC